MNAICYNTYTWHLLNSIFHLYTSTALRQKTCIYSRPAPYTSTHRQARTKINLWNVKSHPTWKFLRYMYCLAVHCIGFALEYKAGKNPSTNASSTHCREMQICGRIHTRRLIGRYMGAATLAYTPRGCVCKWMSGTVNDRNQSMSREHGRGCRRILNGVLLFVILRLDTKHKISYTRLY